MKLGRNDPCYCGSGIKHKKCCLTKYEENIKLSSKQTTAKEFNPVSEFINCYDQIDLLKIVSGLQLIPENHGKNLRFELLAQQIISSLKVVDNKKVDYKSLSNFFDTNLKSYYLEDPPSSLFTENIIFFGGNYTVFSGLSDNGARVLSLYLEAIFITHNKLSKEFKNKVCSGVTLLLGMNQQIVTEINIKRNSFVETKDSKIKVPNEGKVSILKQVIVYKSEYIEKLCTHFGIDKSIIDEFIISRDDKNIDEVDPDKNPLLLRPIFENNDEYILVLPTAIVHCLINFISRVANEMDYIDELDNVYNNHQWYRIREFAYEMGWQETDIKLPKTETDLNINEAVFRFDNNKLAYIRLVNGLNPSLFSEENPSLGDEQKSETRVDTVIKYLEELNGDEVYNYFVIDVLSENASDQFFIGDKPKSDVQSLSMGFFELEKIALSNDTDGLTLWKFAKSFNEAKETTMFMPMLGGVLDAFVHFVNNNEGFFDTDEKKVDGLLLIGNSGEFERKIIIDRDEHSSIKYYEGQLLGMPIKRLRDFAPIYVEKERSNDYNLLLECFKPMLWVVNDQCNGKGQKKIVNIFSEAIVFWIFKMRDVLEPYIEGLNVKVIEFKIELDELLFKPSFAQYDESFNGENIDFKISLNGNSVYLYIPFDISVLLLRSDNSGEKVIMKAILGGLSLLLERSQKELNLTDDIINKMIEDIMQPDIAKMIVFLDSANDMKLDGRNLLPLRKLQESEMTKIQDTLVESLKLTEPIPKVISDDKGKKALSNKVVASLFNNIVTKLKTFDSCELLKWLIKMHETCVQSKAHRKIEIPAKISCFSDYPTEVKKLEREDKELVNTALSLRCLIEFVAANPEFGSKPPNTDDIDELLALMNQLINWGMISDGIDLGISSPEMGLLPSGRIGLSKDFYEEQLKPFTVSKAESAVYGYLKDFRLKLQKKVVEIIDDESEILEIDNAFIDEWRISLSKLLEIKNIIIGIVLDNGDSIIEIEASELQGILKTKMKDLTSEEYKIALDLLTLKKREAIDKAPPGFDKTDVYPWKYNRAISYLRKPIVEIQKTDGKTYYYAGFRHIFSTIDNLYSLLFDGRMKARDNGLLSKYLAKINKEKGDIFRAEVYDHLKTDSTFKTIPYEVKISPNGHLVADKDYGDIDILCIDEKNMIFYSIECKDTVSARIIHEMKTEMDKYLGRNDKDGMIQKHVERDTWIKENINQFVAYFENPDKYQVKSIILTSEDIPLPYLIKEKLPLPMLSYSKLLMQGNEILFKI